MRQKLLFGAALACAAPATAQVADSMSRRIEPNAIDRSLSSRPANGVSAQVAADRERAALAAREAASLRNTPTNSTISDGPTGVQSTASGIAPVPPRR